MLAFAQTHSCKSVDDDLARIQGLLDHLWDAVELRLTTVLETFGEPTRATDFPSDGPVDQIHREIERQTIRFIALRQPVADDLRFIVASLRASIDLERIADHAASIAKRVRAGGVCESVTAGQNLPDMARLVLQSVKELRVAFRHRDVHLAKRSTERDKVINRLHADVSARLRRRMAERPSEIDRCAHLLFISKSLERMGDHAKNIDEHVHYVAEGDAPPRKTDLLAAV